MAIEIERKFLVRGDGWTTAVRRRRRIRQAYLVRNGRVSVRIRIVDAASATLTIKTAEPGFSRGEFEYPIPVADAEALIAEREGGVIAKVRHLVPVGALVWEIDVFEGDNVGLVLAEIELDRVDQPLERPDWIGEEVTHDRRYYNSELAVAPFTSWR